MAPTISKTGLEAAFTIAESSWSQPQQPATLTYGFRQTTTYERTDHNLPSSFSQFTPTQKAYAIAALSLWSEVANITFTPVEANGFTNNATMLFGNYFSGTDGAGAFAAGPTITEPNDIEGDVWIDLHSNSSSSISYGSYEFEVLLHEIGHAIGLSHPGDYNAGPDADPTYDADAEYIEDSRQYSLMSYFSETETGANFMGRYPSTPLLNDIRAIQYIYGSNTSTRSGNTVYGFNSTETAFYPGYSVPSPFRLKAATDAALFCVWDGGGIDTLDFSVYTQDQQISLVAETFSNVGGLVKNVSIAFNVEIENAKGGSGNDRISGNVKDNHLWGNSGADTLNGENGNDWLEGGALNDVLNGGNNHDLLDGGSGADELNGQDGDDELHGGEQNDRLYGGLGNDLSYGGGGDDTIEDFIGANSLRGGGGNDTLLGGSSIDRFFGEEGNDTIWAMSLGGGGGDDYIDGGLGEDTVVFDYTTEGVTVLLLEGSLLPPFASGPEIGNDTILSVENVSGGSGKDRLQGSAANNRLSGNGGDDELRGEGGHDLLDGASGYDTLIGNGDNDIFILADVTHRLFPGPIFSVEDTRYDAVVEAPDGGYDTIRVQRAADGIHERSAYTLPANIERGEIFGSAAFDLTGNASPNALYGNQADNKLSGREGVDLLDGGGGYDTLAGGAQDDLYVLRDVNYRLFQGGGGLSFYDTRYDLVTEAAGEGYDTVQVTGLFNSVVRGYLLPAHVDRGEILGEVTFSLTGNNLNNYLLGNIGPNTLSGREGDDTLVGGGSIDTAVFGGARQSYFVRSKHDAGVPKIYVRDIVGTEGLDTLTTIEVLRFNGVTYNFFSAQQNLTSNVDGARFDDVVYRSVSNGQVIFQNMQGGAPAGFDAITAPLTSAWKAIGTGDVSGDGKADVFIWNSSTGQVLSAARGASGSPTYAVVATGIEGNFAAVGTGDIDGDGFTDVLVRDSGSGTISWRAMTEGTPDAFKPVGTFGSSWSFQGTGDVNRDGFADVAIRSAAGQVVFVNMANGAPSGFIDLGNVSGFRVGAIADLNGDGFDDVVLQNQSNGQAVWRNLSGAEAIWNIATDPMGTSWLLRRGADVDNDGSADLIFQHATTGQTVYRAIDIGIPTGWGNVSNALGTEWVVV